MRQFKISDKVTPRVTKSAESYLNELGKTDLISPEREVELARLAAAGDQDARNQLVKANLRFVVSVAKMYASNPEDFSDIVAAGNMGLIEAAEKFDHTRGFKFISFAVWYIRKEMINHLNENSRQIRVPLNQGAILRDLMKVSNEISMREGREANLDESFEELVEKKEKYSSIKKESVLHSHNADYKLASLSNPLASDSDGGALIDVIDGTVDSTDKEIYDNDIKRVVRLLSNALTPLEKDVVFRRHGITDDGESSIEESFGTIADRWEMSAENARQKYNKAIKKMWIKARKAGVKIHDLM